MAEPNMPEPKTSQPDLPRQSPGHNFLLIGAACLALATLLTWFIIHRWNGEVPQEFRPLTVAPLTGRPGFEQHASFSPDGKQIVFSWDGNQPGSSDLYVCTVGSGGVHRLTTQAGGNDYPVWSPDGLHIAYLHASRDLMLISPHGGSPRQLAEASGHHVAWSVDNASLLYGVPGLGDLADLWSVEIRSGAQHKLEAPVARVDPTIPFGYSPGGRWFAYGKLAEPRVPASPSALYLVGSEGGESRRLIEAVPDLRGWSWFTDREIIFSARRGTRAQLWRFPVMGALAEPVKFEGAGEDGTYPAIAWLTATAGIPSRPLLSYQKLLPAGSSIMLVDGFR